MPAKNGWTEWPMILPSWNLRWSSLGVVSIPQPWVIRLGCVFFFRVEFLWTVGFYGINEYRGTYTIVPWILWGCKCCTNRLLKHLDVFFLVIFHGCFTMGFITIWKTTIWDTFWGTFVQPPNSRKSKYLPHLTIHPYATLDAIGDLCLWRFKCGYFYLSLGAQDGLVSIG